MPTWHGGRAPPSVRRSSELGGRLSAFAGFRESAPFVFFGGACIAIAIWLLNANPVPGDPLPLWILLMGVGILAVGGGLLASIIGEAPPPSVPRSPMTPTRSGRASNPSDERVAPAPPLLRPPPASPSPVRPSARPAPTAARSAEEEAGASDYLGLGGRREAAPAPGPSTFLGPPPSSGAPTLGAARSDRRAETDPMTIRDAGDEVLRSIDELSQMMRAQSRPRVEPAPPAPAGPPRRCVMCSSTIVAPDPGTACSACGSPLCRSCLAQAEQEGHPGICSVCGLLSDVPENPRLR